MSAEASWHLQGDWENLGATAMIAGNIAGKTRTLPMAVYSEVAAGNMDTAYRYVAVIVVIAFLSIILMNWAALRPVNRKG